MAIAFNAATTGSVSDGVTFSFAHTVPSGGTLLVGIADENISFPTSVTYNGVSLSLQRGTSTGNAAVRMYGLVNNAAFDGASHNVVVTFDGNNFIAAGATSWTGVGSISGTTQAASGTDATPTLTISSASGEVVVDALGAFLDGATVDASQTQRYNLMDGLSLSRAAGSSEAGGASVTMSWSKDNVNDWSLVAIALQASASATVDGPLIAGLHFSRIRRF